MSIVFCTLFGSLTIQFPARETVSAGKQAGYQAAALFVSLGLSIIGGLVTGAIESYVIGLVMYSIRFTEHQRDSFHK